MPQITLIHRTDVHSSDRSPASWKASYPDEIRSSLTQIGKIARLYDANAVLDGGDFFHFKAATKTSHALIQQTMALHREYSCPTFCVEGNHDMQYNQLETIARQPLGVLYASKTFQHLRSHVFEDGGMRVRVVGLPFSPHRTLEDIKNLRKEPGDTHLVVVMHALAGLNPPKAVEQFFNEPVFRYEDFVQMDGPDVVLLGHWHKDQGVTRVGDVTFVNQGALSRGALIQEQLDRIPKVARLTFTPQGYSVDSIAIDVAPASDVFDIERKERRDAEAQDIEDFVSSMRDSLSVDAKDDIRLAVRELAPGDERVQKSVLSYLENARSEIE